MSSITELFRGRRASTSQESGQILVIFAGGLVALIAIAALVFDTGQSLLDRRTEQNAADAAALAGARYIPANTATYQGVCPAPAGNAPATAACETAAANGFTNGVDGYTVKVKIPPGPESAFGGIRQYLEVQIEGSRPSFFAGVLGLTQQKTGAIGTATNSSGINLPYSLLSLDPSGCGISKVNGNGGTIIVNAAIHVDSSCNENALTLTGGGQIVAPVCDVVGGFLVGGSSTNHCATTPTDTVIAGDPLKSLPAPAKPSLGNVVKVTGAANQKVPANCPGGTNPTSEAVPATCSFPNSLSTASFRLSPGYYPGGLKFTGGTFYMEPGIYWIGGGGFQVNNNSATVLSTASGGTTFGGGVMIYDTQDPLYTTQCLTNRSFPAGTIGAQPSVAGAAACYGGIAIQSGTVSLLAMQATIYKGMVLFVDRTLSYRTSTPIDNATGDVRVEGNLASVSLAGTIYDALGLVVLNGDTADSVSSQIISYDFQVNGNGAGMTINFDGSRLFTLSGVGLVE